jgi:hypothetical protein
LPRAARSCSSLRGASQKNTKYPDQLHSRHAGGAARLAQEPNTANSATLALMQQLLPGRQHRGDDDCRPPRAVLTAPCRLPPGMPQPPQLLSLASRPRRVAWPSIMQKLAAQAARP